MTDQQSPPEPVVVKDDFATNAGWQLFRVTVVFVAGAAASRFFEDAQVTAAALAAAAAIPPVAYGLWKAWRSHKMKLTLASFLPDFIAQVKK